MERTRRGFTLVEVIVVLLILALLAAIMIPALAGYIDKAKATECGVTAGEVARYYHAGAAYLAYQVDDPAVPLSGALTDVGCAPAGNGYVSPCGGTCSIAYADHLIVISSITCSNHGVVYNGSGQAAYTPVELASRLAGAADSLKSTLLGYNRDIHSAGTGDSKGWEERVKDALPADVASALDGNTWKMEPTNRYASYNVVVYEGILTADDVNKQIDVTVYHSATGETTSEKRRVGTATLNGTSGIPVIVNNW